MSDLFEERFHLDPEYLDKLAQEGYYKYFLHDHFLDGMKIIADWFDSVSPDLSVMEIGSGQAPLLQRLRPCYPYTGIELSGSLVRECQSVWRGRPETEFIQADVERFFETTTKTADVLYDGNTLWYVKKDKILPFVLNALRRIKASYFITCEASAFKMPTCNSLQLILSRGFNLNILEIPEFKRNRRIEIYRYVGRP